jgi:NAD(P)-dependent dehydrogenase (short-subunit alcohol dehydrogenase family)
MSFLSSGVAVVTGAGSGIGRALAQQLAAAGSALALADIDEARLQQTVQSLAKSGARDRSAKSAPLVTTHAVDVAKEESVKSFADDVQARHGRVTLLINNAGVALHGNFEEVSLDDFHWLMDINFWGAVYGVRYFLRLLKREPRAHMVNLSSVFGLIAPAGQAAYAASKFAVRGFTEALRHELYGSNVCVSSVHPGGIQTPIARHARLGAATPSARKEESIARFELLARTPPEKAAAVILRGVERRKPRILIGADAYQMDFLQRLRPASYWKVLAKLLEDPRARGEKSKASAASGQSGEGREHEGTKWSS